MNDGVVGIALFDESGWAADVKEWGDAEIAKGLLYTLGVDEQEAEAVEREVLADWQARGGRPTGRWDDDDSAPVLALLVGILVLALGVFITGAVTVARFAWGVVS